MKNKNVGTIDRYIRYSLGIILLVGGIFLVATGTYPLGIILIAVSVIPLATATLSFCPLYLLAGINTRSHTKSNTV